MAGAIWSGLLVTLIPPQNLEAEQAVLGAMMVSDSLAAVVLSETGLRAEHFFREGHRYVFAAMAALHERMAPTDSLATIAELDHRGTLEKAGGKGEVAHLANTVPAPTNAPHYAKLVLEAAEWRSRLNAAHLIRQAVADTDEAKLAAATDLLTRDVVRSTTTFEPPELFDKLIDHLDAPPETGIPWPFAKLNRLLGPMKPGQVTLIGGHTSHGKSVLLDQMLETARKHGARCHLYLTEMRELERVLRFISRRTGILFRELERKVNLTDSERTAIIQAGNEIPFGITNAAEWTAPEIAFHVRRHRWEVVGLDLLHLIPYADEAELRRISATLNAMTKLADCHLLACVHLNEKRVTAGVRPRPSIGDIRDSGMLKNDADTVIFVHREQDPATFEILPDAIVFVAKARHGEVGGLPVTFHGRRLRFELPTIVEAPAHQIA